jgi:hypothetical protein
MSEFSFPLFSFPLFSFPLQLTLLRFCLKGALSILAQPFVVGIVGI